MLVPPCPPVVFFQVLLCGRRLLSLLETENQGEGERRRRPLVGTMPRPCLSSLFSPRGQGQGYWDWEKKDELCTERGSILRNSSFSLQYFAIFVLKQSCIRQDEGEHTLNLSAEMEPWQEVCFSSSFCKFALARGTVLTCPGEWKPFLFLGKLRARKEGRAQVLVCLVLLKTANTWLIYFAKGVTTWKKRTPLGFSCKSCQVMNKQNSG